MIKKFKLLIILILFIGSKTHALSPEYEKQLYIGCYGNSKTYIGSDGAKIYCTCTIHKLSKKFSDNEMDLIFKQKPEEIMKSIEFSTIECENNK
tara:strand:+ start:348 stop:629 length:282 start_codon:yes stop_codon:yes gene_type:complete